MSVAVEKPDAKRQRRRFQFGVRTLLVGITFVALLLGLGIMAVPWVEHAGVRVHQRAITRELNEWGAKYSHIENQQDAFRAIEILRSMEHYYVPGEGYRSDAATEATLQATRRKAMGLIIESLEGYTGEHFGSDLDQWEAWRKQQATMIPLNE